MVLEQGISDEWETPNLPGSPSSFAGSIEDKVDEVAVDPVVGLGDDVPPLDTEPTMQTDAADESTQIMEKVAADSTQVSRGQSDCQL
jgi:hypothetical protein